MVQTPHTLRLPFDPDLVLLQHKSDSSESDHTSDGPAELVGGALEGSRSGRSHVDGWAGSVCADAANDQGWAGSGF